MSTEVGLGQVGRAKISYRGVGADGNSIYPRIQFSFEITNNSGNSVLLVEFLSVDVSVRNKTQGSVHYLGQLVPSQPMTYLHPSGSFQLSLFLVLDHFGLARLERLRAGGDLWMLFNATLAGELRPPLTQGQTQGSQPGLTKSPGRIISDSPVQFEFRIPKSDWVELVLPAVGFSEVSLIQLPKLVDPQFADSVGYLNSAWRQYELGEYDRVLIDCRKTLESITKRVKEKGLSRELDGKSLPDWDKLFDSGIKAETVAGIFQKSVGYMSPGAHAGSSRSREEAEFALMVTHGLANLVVKRVAKTGE